MTTSGTQLASGSGYNNTSQNQTGQQSYANMNAYTAGQQQLQQQLPQAYSNFLNTGNLPGTFAAPQQVISAFNSNYQQQEAPQIASTYGANSPLISGQYANGLQQLLSNLYQNQAGNFSNVLGGAQNLAFNPIGATGGGSSATGTTQNTNTGWQSGATSLGTI